MSFMPLTQNCKEQDSKWEKSRQMSQDFQKKRLDRLRNTEDMQPPWKEFPNRPRDAGWRMGTEESFLGDWYLWLNALTQEQREAYRRRHPEPQSWSQIYDSAFKNAPNRKTWDDFWNEELEKAFQQIESQIEFAKKHSS